MKTPEKIYVEAPTGYKGRVPVKNVPVYRETREDSIMLLEDVYDNPEEKYKEGFRIYSRYVDRYGFELLRDPNGKITRIGEQVG